MVIGVVERKSHSKDLKREGNTLALRGKTLGERYYH